MGTCIAKEASRIKIKHRVEFQIMKYLVFVLALKEKCTPHGERRRQ